MINFLDLLFPSAFGTIAKLLSESRAKFSLSRRPSGQNTGGPQGPELTSAWLIDGFRAEAEKFKANAFFRLSWLVLLSFFPHAFKTYAATHNTKTWTVSLVGKWSLFCLLKEIFQCRPLANTFFSSSCLLFLFILLFGFSSLSWQTCTHKHIFHSYGILFFSQLCFSLFWTTVFSFCFPHIHCLLPIYNSHRRRPFSL